MHLEINAQIFITLNQLKFKFIWI